MSLKTPVEFEFTAAGQASGYILLKGFFSFSLRGAFSGTIYVQRSYDFDKADADKEWGKVDSYTAVVEKTGYEPEGALYRAYCYAYTSGAPKTRFGQ